MKTIDLLLIIEDKSPILFAFIIIFVFIIVWGLVIRPLIAIGDIPKELSAIRHELEKIRKGENNG